MLQEDIRRWSLSHSSFASDELPPQNPGLSLCYKLSYSEGIFCMLYFLGYFDLVMDPPRISLSIHYVCTKNIWSQDPMFSML